MTNDKPANHQGKRFDAFLERKPVRPWNQKLFIMKEKISIEQTDTGSVYVFYEGDAPAIQALMVALCSIYRGYEEVQGIKWYFHSQLQPCLQIALLALQDKSSCLLIEEISNLREQGCFAQER
tara:strand:- start:36380 stop:36748 length:369 start_codon:yes stop_codon:yes gene_type:complete